jgi:hypothetical protein
MPGGTMTQQDKYPINATDDEPREDLVDHIAANLIDIVNKGQNKDALKSKLKSLRCTRTVRAAALNCIIDSMIDSLSTEEEEMDCRCAIRDIVKTTWNLVTEHTKDQNFSPIEDAMFFHELQVLVDSADKKAKRFQFMTMLKSADSTESLRLTKAQRIDVAKEACCSIFDSKSP